MSDDRRIEIDDQLRRKDRQLPDKLFGAFSLRTGATSSPRGSVIDQLRAVAGPGKRGAPVDTAAAAKQIGVSRRTVQRWVAGGKIRFAKDREALAKAAKRSVKTKTGRRAAVRETREKFAKTGARLWVRGQQGPVNDSGDFQRDRRTYVDLSPETLNALMDAYEDGGDKAALERMRAIWDGADPTQSESDGYAPDWSFSEIKGVSFGEYAEASDPPV